MPKILYTVRAILPTLPLQSRFMAWLVPDHAIALKEGGAEAVRVVLPDRTGGDASFIVEAQYTFPSRTAFDTYVQIYAPALRADNVKNFPPELGIRMERQIAEIAAEL